MTSPEVVYLSSDDEPIFECNQRLLKEHYKQEDRHNIQKHLSRALEEVKEGILPRAVPLDNFLAVTVAYEPRDLYFNIMSQESQTDYLSPPPVVISKALPYDALKYQSTITWP